MSAASMTAASVTDAAARAAASKELPISTRRKLARLYGHLLHQYGQHSGSMALSLIQRSQPDFPWYNQWMAHEVFNGRM